MRPKLIGILTAAFLISFAIGPFTALLGAATASETYITTADVPLRSGPGMNYATVTTLPKGIKINVVGRQGYWLKVESKHGGAPGYIDGQFAEPESNAQNTTTRRAPEPVAGLYRTLKDVDLRQGPGSNYPVVANSRPASKLTSLAPKVTGLGSSLHAAPSRAIWRRDS